MVRALVAAASMAAAMALWAGSAGAQEMQRVCCTDPVPHGFIKVGDMWNPTDCGQPQKIEYNQCYIERYEGMAVGATLEVCASAGTPSGWKQVSTTWNPTKCGNPTAIVQNVATIKRER
jgi:hypothetical protein